ncbi:Sensor protein [Planktothrix tepida]|uniref:histidine kinase n=2 Tax=Planktothrix TaxID=54304 RepID=A0A1J1LS38_9CYAN|nr:MULTISPECIES: ATP-binding protein [Planktothrix]CAD5942115.1 Sensor protein [Planktothrix pseudagardhii]CAD5968740.1 Sensor protein [Planktothrix tepida]CUR35215.1 Sensor protein [Planktothrix tepida PCC 9214]
MRKLRFSTLQELPLQLVLIIPFVVQIFGTVSLVGYLSFKNGQKAVDDLANQLMQRTSSIVNHHLDSYLSIPHKVSQMNADGIRMGLLNVRDRKTLGRYFWYQMQAYDLTYIGIALTTGEGLGAARYDGKTITIDDWTAQLPNNCINYATDNQGNRTKVNNIYNYNNFEQSWYLEPVKAGKPIWSGIYTWNSPFGPYITAATGRPIYDQNNRLLGMVGADIHLSKLSNFLQGLEVSHSGKVFILERNGMLIANSGKNQPFILVNDKVQRLKAVNSPDPIVQGIAKQLQQRFKSFDTITETKELEFDFQNKPYYVHITPWRDQYGLDWLVVVSVPQSAFMGQINANTQTTIWLCFAALVVASMMGIFTSRWISRPIFRLNQASELMALGNLDQIVKGSRIKELNKLTDSFNYMAGKLRQSFTALEKSNEALEERVEERTMELKNALSELQHTQAQVVQNEKMSSLGQLVAGVAHEINNPVNFIHGNLVHLNEYIQDLLNLIQLYEQHSNPNNPEIQNFIEEIDLDFLIADLPKTLSSMKVGASRIREIVLTLRNFSRLDEAEMKPVNIHEGIDSTLLILQHRIKSRPEQPEIEVIKDYGNLPLVECYAGQLNQVFMNILTNAIDALEEKSRTENDFLEENQIPLTDKIHNQIKISTSMLDSEWVQISLSDNGIGIPQNIQQQIFNPFFTTKPIGKGTGLGMSISYQIIVEKHGGKLKCISIPNQGTEFVIQIPIHQKID